MHIHERKKIVDLRPGAAGHASHSLYMSGHPVMGFFAMAASVVDNVVNFSGEKTIYKCSDCGATH